MGAESPTATGSLDVDAGLDAKRAAALLGIGTTLFDAMRKDGRLGPVPYRLGRRVIWIRSDLLAWRAAGCPRRERWEAMRMGGRP
jgi:predicted DNA-binding transcriptional regulator AlpA